ncbi:MAG: hypothetical protein HYW25_03705 [Candidatus Aenigmarchaeota archaeon]|nr:hypothetical protein [Candidatus Aenigmarchaeota archaeon]
MDQNNEWIKTNFKELRRKYPGKYIAVSGGRVIASGGTAKEVLKKVENEDIKKIRFTHVPETKAVFYRCKSC